MGVIACVALSAGTFVFERAIVTPREQIDQHVLDLAQAFQDRNEEKTLDFISQRADHLRNQVKLGFALVTHVDHLRITDTDVVLLADGSRARQHFRANGTVSARDYGNIGHKPTRWQMTWQQEAGQWKIIEIQRLDTITGEPIGLLDARD